MSDPTEKGEETSGSENLIAQARVFEQNANMLLDGALPFIERVRTRLDQEAAQATKDKHDEKLASIQSVRTAIDDYDGACSDLEAAERKLAESRSNPQLLREANDAYANTEAAKALIDQAIESHAKWFKKSDAEE